jgi:hypothetical protein
MPNWIHIDQDALAAPRVDTLRGVDVTIYFSPYDVPEAVRGDYDPSRKRFVVQFKYPGGEEEPDLEPQQREHALFRVGRRTGRLYEIEVDVDSLGAQTVGLNFQTAKAQKAFDVASAAIKVFSPGRGRMAPNNYIAASGAISQVKEQLVDSLAAVK